MRALSRKRGFRNAFRIEYEPVNIASLARFAANSEVTLETLKQAGLVKTGRPVKILGEGELAVVLTVRAHKFSAGAREKIEKAGGKAEEIASDQ